MNYSVEVTANLQGEAGTKPRIKLRRTLGELVLLMESHVPDSYQAYYEWGRINSGSAALL